MQHTIFGAIGTQISLVGFVFVVVAFLWRVKAALLLA